MDPLVGSAFVSGISGLLGSGISGGMSKRAAKAYNKGQKEIAQMNKNGMPSRQPLIVSGKLPNVMLRISGLWNNGIVKTSIILRLRSVPP